MDGRLWGESFFLLADLLMLLWPQGFPNGLGHGTVHLLTGYTGARSTEGSRRSGSGTMGAGALCAGPSLLSLLPRTLSGLVETLGDSKENSVKTPSLRDRRGRWERCLPFGLLYVKIEQFRYFVVCYQDLPCSKNTLEIQIHFCISKVYEEK